MILLKKILVQIFILSLGVFALNAVCLIIAGAFFNVTEVSDDWSLFTMIVISILVISAVILFYKRVYEIIKNEYKSLIKKVENKTL